MPVAPDRNLAAHIGKIVPLARRPAAAERVAAQLLELIRSGNLKPGDVLPGENDLAQTLQVSRPVIREALRGLQILGVVDTRQGGRCYVTDLSVARLFEPFQFVMGLNESNVDQLFRARVTVECELVRLAAANVDDRDLGRLRELVAAGYGLTADPAGFRVVDLEFHQSLMRLGENPFLEVVAKGFYGLGIDYRRVASEMPGVIARSAAEHEAIVQALAGHDPDSAAEAMRTHLMSINRTTFQAMQQLGVAKSGQVQPPAGDAQSDAASA